MTRTQGVFVASIAGIALGYALLAGSGSESKLRILTASILIGGGFVSLTVLWLRRRELAKYETMTKERLVTNWMMALGSVGLAAATFIVCFGARLLWWHRFGHLRGSLLAGGVTLVIGMAFTGAGALLGYMLWSAKFR
jgi:hypothetical protein